MSETPIGQCSRRVPTKGLRMHYHQCERKAVAVEDGAAYCKQHLPSLIKARQDASYEEYQREHKARAEKHERAAAEHECLRGIPTEALQTLWEDIHAVIDVPVPQDIKVAAMIRLIALCEARRAATQNDSRR